MLVPNLVPEAQHAALWLESSLPKPVVIEWNDRRVALAVVGKRTAVEFEIPAGDLHTNGLRIVGSMVQVGTLELAISMPAH